MILDQNTVLELVQANQSVQPWVNKSREMSRELKALVLGKDFHAELIDRIEILESDARAKARVKYSKDIRDVFERILKKRDNVFQSSGGSEEIKISSEEMKKQFIDALSKFKGGKSIQKYLSEYFFQQLDTDPNGVIFLEYKIEDGELEIYPTYKSINDIRNYDADGQLCEYILFEGKKEVYNGQYRIKWRVVDELTDWCVIQIGTTFLIDPERTFQHPFGQVPAVILSDKLTIGEKTRLSPLTPVIEIAKDLARDKSILTIYKFQNGFPKNWQYVSECRSCHGTGKTGKDGNNQKGECSMCSGTGILQKKDVTDMLNITKPKEGDPILTPNIAGFISPDLATWTQYKTDLKDFEIVMEDTLWGTDRSNNNNSNGRETATGRFIDVQPVTNQLNKLTDSVEWVHNTLANWVANAIVKTKQKDETAYHKSYGRRFIIESPDAILDKYETAREKGSGTTILDKLIHEYILSKYKNDPFMQEKMLKKAMVEPYLHFDIEQVSSIFGKKEAYKKVVFQDFWEESNNDLSVQELKDAFIVYFNERLINDGIMAEPTPIPPIV